MTHAHAAAQPTSTGLPSGRVAIWWFLASEVAIFGGAVVCYVLCRQQHPEWGAEAARTLTWAGALNTVVLLSSSLSAALADAAADAGAHRRAVRLLGLTIAGGGVFLAVKAYEYAHEIGSGLVPARSLFWSFYYTMTGLHALHVVVGMIALGAVAGPLRRGLHAGRVEIAAIYWHFVDVVWIFLFPLLYLAS